MALERSPALNRLTLEQVERLIDVMRIKEYPADEVVVKKNTPIKNAVYILLKG